MGAKDEGAGMSRTARVPAPFVAAFLGMGFSVAFQQLFFVHTDPNPVLLGNQATLPYHVASVCAFVACALASRRKGFTLAGRPGAPLAAACCCAAGVLAVLVSGAGLPARPGAALFALGSVVVACSNAVLLLAWFELIARMSMDYALLYYVSATLAGSLVRYLAGLLLPAGGVRSLLVVLPLCSAACLIACSRRVDTLPYAHGEAVEPRWDVPWRPVALLFVFCWAAKLTLNVVSPDLREGNSIGNTAAYLAIFLIVVLGFHRFSLQVIRLSSLPLLTAGVLCAMLGPSLTAAGVVLTSLARGVFLIYAVAMLCDVCYRRGVNPVWVFGLVLACSSLGLLAANLTSMALTARLADPLFAQEALAAVVVVSTVAFLTLSSDRDEEDAWGLDRRRLRLRGAPAGGFGPPAASTPAELDALLAQRCGKAARVYGLTRREEEVLRLRLGGASLKQVEDELVLSHNTVKSHVRHIYAKLGAASLEEARAKVEAL